MLALLLPSTCWPDAAPAMAQAQAARMHWPELMRWSRRLGTAGLTLMLAGCMLRPLHSGKETQIDSIISAKDVAVGIAAKPFCLHVRFRNHFFPAYSDDLAEAWVTDGTCASKGPPRAVSVMRLSWWYDWKDTQSNRQCMATDRCSAPEEHVLVGLNIHCVAAHAVDGPNSAFITTNQAVCH